MEHRSVGGRRAPWLGGRVAALAFCAAVGVAVAWPASAWEFFEDNPDLRLNVDTTLSAGASVRVEDRDNKIIFGGNDPRNRSRGSTRPHATRYTNADDGNLNYDQWDFYSVNLKATFDVELDYQVQNAYLLGLGAFARAVGFYDFFGNCRSCTRRTNLNGDARHRSSVISGGVVGTQWIFLDAYADATFDVMERFLNLRVGNQVLAWGQTIFYQGGINTINAVDVAKLRVPGSELREGLVPAPMVRVQADLIENLTVEGYYQFRWNRTEVDPTGSYFSISDVVGRATEGLFFGNDPGSECEEGPPLTPPTITNPDQVGCQTNVFGIPRLKDIDPSFQGQGGVALRYYWDIGGGVDLALNYIRYHSKVPFVAAVAQAITLPPPLPPLVIGNPIGYRRDYGDDIDLLGANFSFEWLSTQWGGEVSYRFNDVVPISTSVQDATDQAAALAPGETATVRGWDRTNRLQAQLNFIGNLSGSTRWGIGPIVNFLRVNNIVFLGEGVVVVYPEFNRRESSEWAAPPGRNANQVSGGYQLVMRFEYTNPMDIPINLTPSVAWRHDVGGDSPNGPPLIQQSKAVTVGFEINYLNRWLFQMTYANFFGAGDANLQNDRDFMSWSLSYNF